MANFYLYLEQPWLRPFVSQLVLLRYRHGATQIFTLCKLCQVIDRTCVCVCKTGRSKTWDLWKFGIVPGAGLGGYEENDPRSERVLHVLLITGVITKVERVYFESFCCVKIVQKRGKIVSSTSACSLLRLQRKGRLGSNKTASK